MRKRIAGSIVRTGKSGITILLATTMIMGLFTGCSKESKTTSDNNGYTPELPTEAVESSIYVEPIDGLSEDFIKGVDISSVIAEENSGVTYYNEAGEEQDIFKTLADAGVNYIRVRVWNDPYDSDGNGYGGGNNDVDTAVEIAKRAAKYNLKLNVDFHYSDFWADPTKQFAPKEWAHMTFADKEEALYTFTKESLQEIAKTGVDIGMVQIGNEINNGMAGETESDNVIALLKQGSKAVREFSEENDDDVLITTHVTDINDKEKTLSYAKDFEDAGLDYDVFGVSYYTFWHGTLENLTDVLTEISTTYDKKVCVLETSYAYTTEDGDGSANSVAEADLIEDYAASVQSQATCVRDVMAAVALAGEKSLGVFYWEPAWIPVGEDADKNSAIWEKYGSGWASSYAGKYDPDDAGQYYGGSSWDNQAMFDFDGKPLESLNVFKYVNYGTKCELAVDYAEDIIVNVNVGEEVVMPETVDVVYNDRSKNGAASVTWKEDYASKVDTSKGGDYDITGTLEDGTEVSGTLHVAYVNLLENSSFEETDMAMWEVSYEGDENPTDVQNKESDALSGENAFHFWSESSDQEFSIEQTVSGLEAGTYSFNANIQGGDVGDDAEIYAYVIVDGKQIKSELVTLDGWCNWKNPVVDDITVEDGQEITIGMYVKAASGGWGTLDDFYLYKK